MSKVVHRPAIWRGHRVFCSQPVVGGGKYFTNGFDPENTAFYRGEIHFGSQPRNLIETRRNRQAHTESGFCFFGVVRRGVAWHTVRLFEEIFQVFRIYTRTPMRKLAARWFKRPAHFRPYQTN